MKLQDALNQLDREVRRAGQRIALERGVRAGLPLALALGGWAALALAGAHEVLPLLAQTLTSIAALAVFGWLAWRTQHAWKTPSKAEARARLERDCRLSPGAFESLDDRPSRYDAFSVALWRREQDEARENAARARAGPLRLKLKDIDRYYLRYAVLAALIGAAVLAGALGPDRLARAFLPDPGPLLGDQAMAVEAWATPAEYTHAAPVSLSDRLGQRVETPPSIEATVRVTGPAGAPKLVFEGRGGRREVRFTRAADGAWEAQMRIPGPGRLKIVRFHTRGFWRMQPAPDAAPTALFAAPIATLPNERAIIGWSAKDDFGLSRLALRVRPVNPPEGLRNADPVDIEFESPAGDPREAEGQSELELAQHPYAGMEVEARVVAFDGLGQAGESPAQRFTMPEKVFLQPLARAAIEIRQHVLWERRAYRDGDAAQRRQIQAGDILIGNQRIELRDYDHQPSLRRSPEGIRHAARLIEAVTMAPEDGYYRDLAVFLGFRQARAELDVAANIDDTNLAADTLWRTALRAEYGGAADARRALEAAQRALAEALERGDSRERIEQLMQALRQATANYLQALVQEAVREGQQQSQEDTEEQTQLSAQDIEELMQQVQELSRQGRNEEAQALLQQLASLLQNLEVSLAEGGQSEEGQEGQEGEQQQQMQQSMDQLSEAMGEQRQLNDETQRQREEREAQGGGGQGQQGGAGGGGELGERQAAIRESLGQAQEMAGEAGAAPSEELSNAQQAMQRAEAALQRGDLQGARAAQDAALQSLREGAEQLAAEIREGGRENDRRRGADGPRDPLGRPMPGAGNGDGDTQVPTQVDPVRAREILDEIRRRAQDPNRPEAEREYLRRLLDRFSDS